MHKRLDIWRDPQSAAALFEVASQTYTSAPLNLYTRHERRLWRRILRRLTHVTA